MFNINLITPDHAWPWRRQLPNNGSEWGPFRFFIDDPINNCDALVVFETSNHQIVTRCPSQRTVFIAGEPSSIGNYHPDFLEQFSFVVSCNSLLPHRNILKIQPGHPWFVEQTYDDLISMQPMQKSKDLCLIVSDKDFTLGHKKRLKFVESLVNYFGDRLHVYGRGIQDFESKWDVLSQYRFTIVLENTEESDFITEKLPDAWLAFCFPFYAGAPNLHRYYPPGGHIEINLDSVSQSIALIDEVLSINGYYEDTIDLIKKNRSFYLQNYQFFPNLVSILQNIFSVSRNESRTVAIISSDFFWAREKNKEVQNDMINYLYSIFFK